MINQLYYGDNLEVLRYQIKDESVDLCYIDPPFKSQHNYYQIYTNIGKEEQTQAFIDTWKWDDHAHQGLGEIQSNYEDKFSHQCIDLITGLNKVLGKSSLLAYLISITLRITEIHRVLKQTGSFYLHCDPTASHYLKMILDAVFCSQGGDFQNEIIWCYTIGGKSSKRFARKHDVIFFYTKHNQDIHTFNKQGASIARKTNSHMKIGIDEAGRQYQQKKDKKTGKIYRYYLDEGKIAEDYWIDIETLNREDRERLGYPTQKPEALLERIIKTSSNEGDLVLDAYCGGGTTIAVAQKLKRQWIGIDITYQSISLILKRLEDSFGKGILTQIQLHGIPKDMDSAIALANKQDDRTRKEFEKWAVLTYTNNRAIIKDVDQGIEAIAYFQIDKDKPEKIIFQVKLDQVKSRDIRELQEKMTLKQAAIGIFITLQPLSKAMIKTAKTAGIYQNKHNNQSIDKISIVTIEEILKEKKRLDICLVFDVLKSAEKQP